MVNKKNLDALKKSHDLLVDGEVGLNRVIMSFDSGLSPEEKTELSRQLNQIKSKTAKIKEAIDTLVLAKIRKTKRLAKRGVNGTHTK